MSRRADTVDADILRAEGLRHAGDELLGARLGVDATDTLDERLERGKTFPSGIDRAPDRGVGGLARGEGPDRRGEILEQQRRTPRLDADHAAGGVGDPALGGTGDHHLARLRAFARIDEHILHAGQAGEPLDVVGDIAPFRGGFGHLGLEPRQRDLAEGRTLTDVARERSEGSRATLSREPGIGDEARAKNPLGIDHHASSTSGAAKTATATHAPHATATHTAHATAAHATAAHATTTHSAAAHPAPTHASHATATHAAAHPATAHLAEGGRGGRHDRESHSRRRKERGDAAKERLAVGEGL